MPQVTSTPFRTILGEQGGILFLASLVFLLDLAAPVDWAIPILYLVPLWLSYDLPRRQLSVELSVLFTLLVVLGFVWSPRGVDPMTAGFNRALVTVVLWVFAFGILSRKQLREQAARAVAGREQAERQHSESEARFTQLVTEVRDYAICRLDRDGRVETWNAGAERLTGYRAQDILGAHFSRFHRSEDVAAGHPESLLLRAAREGRVEEEGWWIRKDGARFFADVVITSLRDASGQVNGYAEIVRDLTERNRLQEQFRLAVEAAPNGMVLTDERRRIRLANAQIERIFGYMRDELMDQPVELLVPDEEQNPHHRFRDVCHGDQEAGAGRPFSGRRKDGTIVPLEIGLSPIRTLPGVCILAAVVDLSERRRAEEGRRTLDERLQNILNSMEEIVWSTSVDMTQLFYISPAAARVYGLAPKEFTAHPTLWFDAIHEADRATVSEAVERLLEVGEFEVEYRIVRPDRSVRWLRDRGRVIKDARGQPLRIDGLATDITERKQAETMLRENEARLRGTLDNLLEGCQIIGFDWRYQYVNEAAARHGRRTPAELVGRTMMEAYPGIEDTAVFAALRRGMEERTPESLEAEFTFPDGSSGLFEISIRPVPEGIFVLSNEVSDRRRAEEALRENRQRLELALKGADQGLWDWNVRTGSMYVDERWADMLGYRHEDIEPHVRSWERLVHPEDLPHVMTAMQHHLEGKTSLYRTEHRLRTKSGGWKWILASGRVVERDAEGRPIRAVGTHQDITDRKQAELALAQLNAELESRVRARTEELANANQELRDSSRRFRAIFNSTYQFIGLLTPAGALLEANQSSLEFVGVPASEVLGRLFWETPWWRHSPEDQARLREAVRSAAQGEFVRFETSQCAHDGALSVFDFSIKPIFDENRLVVLLVAEGRDITERKRSEQVVQQAKDELDIRVRERTAALAQVNARLAREVGERRAAEQRVSQVVELAPSGIVLVDEAGAIRLVNRRIEEQFGYSREELLGESVERLIPASVRAEHAAHRRRFWMHPETRPMGKGRDLHGLRKDGSEFPIEIGLSPIHTPEGPGVLASIVDITERKRLEEQLRKTERIAELGTLASGMAHEIGTPMNVILGRAEYLLQRTTDETLRKGLRTIVTQVERITKVMKQLLAFARRRSPQRCSVDLRRSIEESLEMFRERFGRRRITVETQFDDPLPSIQADPDQMAQILINLVMNSVHAMSEGGTLRVTAGRVGGQVAIEVRDSGHGIPPDVLARIFDPFFTTKDTGEGTGLGLTVVKGIIEEHEGTITISSEVDEGTTVRILLPVASAPPAPA